MKGGAIKRWADTDVNIVELIAFGFGLAIGGALGVAGYSFGWVVLPAAAVIGGLIAIIRGGRAGRRQPWWRTPDGPGSRQQRD